MPPWASTSRVPDDVDVARFVSPVPGGRQQRPLGRDRGTSGLRPHHFCSGSFRLCCPREHITMSEVPRAETFVFLDLEATGLPSVDPEVAEISLFAVHRSSLENPDRDESGVPVLPRILDKLTLCMSPERPFTAKASEITGLSSDSLARCRKAGFDSSVVRTLQAFLSRQEGPVCLVAHNGFDYDFPLLCTELRRLGAHLPPDTICLDTLPALRGLDRAHSHGTRAQGFKGYSLGSLFRRYFHAEPSAAHSAEGDVHTLLMVFLHRAAELLGWADEQARSWARIEPMYEPPDRPSVEA
ncbi:three prime repair exonuclease [Lynx pardinus]|uniref:exodeoxyribonuclease III n=1 Tax=Lynx pardinus TaxID=191816 RepID=A0A485PC99_LYNPA|nr:three prime repair exonuclease [Lynx pardinus]